MLLSGKIDQLDMIRKYGIVFDPEENKALPISTTQYSEMLGDKMVPHWI